MPIREEPCRVEGGVRDRSTRSVRSLRSLVGAVLGALFVACAHPSAKPRPVAEPWPTGFQALLDANSAFYARRWTPARTAYQARVAATPDDGPSWFQLGEVNYLIGDYGASAAAFERSAALGFERGEALAGVAAADARQRKATEAARAMGDAVRAGYRDLGSLATDPDFAAIHAAPAWSQVLDSLASVDAALSPLALRGDSLIGAHDWPAAAQAYGDVVARFPNDGRSWYRYGLTRYYERNYAAASAAFEHAGALPYDRVNALYNLASTQALAGDSLLALASLRRAFAAGYVDLAGLAGDRDLASLHGTATWDSVLAANRLDHAGFPLAFPARDRSYWPTRGWQRRAPADVGMDAELLRQADRNLESEVPDATSLLVVRQGFLVHETYFHGHRATDPVNVKSVTKSVTSALVGIAMSHGILRDANQPIAELFPEVVDAADSLKRRITIGQLLSMTSGLQWVENGPVTREWQTASDPVDFTLDLPMKASPGEQYIYSTANYHLLSVALARAAGESTYDFARRFLFDPIGVAPSSWATDPQGRFNGGSELRLTPEEMAKFGFLYLNGGRWEGQQVVPREWIAVSTAPRAPQANAFDGYGYGWRPWNARGHAAFYALGFGGQYIVVVPDLDLVVVMTSHVVNPRTELRPVVLECVLPAVRSQR